MSDQVIKQHPQQHPLHPDIERVALPDKNRPRPRKRRPSCLLLLTRWSVLLAALLVVLGAAGALLAVYGERGFVGRIYPNISVRGVDLSYHNKATARATLEQRYASFLQQPIELSYAGQVWHPTARQLGVRLGFDEALDVAVAFGRARTRVDSARTIAAIWDYGIDVPLRMRVDQADIQDYLLKVAQEVERNPRNADVRLEGSQVLVTTEQAGLQLLADETLHDITVALQTMEPQPVQLRTRTLTPVVRDSDIAPIVAELQTIFNGTIVLTSQSSRCVVECRWEWTPETIAEWVSLKRSITQEGRLSIKVDIDQAAIQRALIPIAAEVQEDGALPRVAWNNGNLLITHPGTPGRGLDTTLALTYIKTALQGGERNILLPMTSIPPPVISSDLASLGISAPVGIGVSSFRASQQYRITNIQAGARRMSGILIPPGETFSFNDNLGVVDANNGFVQGSAIVQNRTQQEWGGGLCQVSTTMFRAAFWAGLPITERHEHTFRIRWYEELGEPPGLDATIFTGVSDLQFVNDTGGWLLSEAYVDLARQQLTIVLYGKPSNRQVTMSHQVISQTAAPSKPLYIDDPSLRAGTTRQTDWAQPGLTVEVYRMVMEDGQVVRQDEFDSVFEPWPNIFLRGVAR